METLFDVTPPARGPQTTASELAKRDAALSAHEDNYRDTLETLRRLMKWLYASRRQRVGDAAFVTADDARRALRDNPVFTGRTFRHMKWLGALFNPRDWEQTGQTIRSQTPGSHGNILPCWRLKENR